MPYNIILFSVSHTGRDILDNNELIDFFTQKVPDISETFEVEVLTIECGSDHVHMIFTSKPTLDIPPYMNTLNTITSREIQRNFPTVKKNSGRGRYGHAPIF